MIRGILSFFLLFLFSCLQVSFGYSEEASYIGENPGIDFYSKIDTAGEVHIQALVKKNLSKYPTFRGFGRECRASADWLDGEKMDEALLLGLKNGNYSGLMTIISKHRVPISSESLIALSSCLIETYEKLIDLAIDEDHAISIVGNAGIYTDGSKENSDYDLLSDIEKINTILFSDPQKYNGVKNPTSSARSGLMRGDYSQIGPITLSTSENTSSGNQKNNTNVLTFSGSSNTTSSLAELGFGASCSIPSSSGTTTSIENIADAGFQSELANILSGYTPTTSTYQSPQNTKNTNATPNPQASKSAGNDFFHTMPCDGIFCIKVKMNAGSMNMLGGGKDLSIEGIIDQHTKTLNPISWTDLSQQKMTNNSFQLPFLNIKIKSKIAGLRTYITTRPQEVRVDKKEETPQKKEAQFEKMKQCANAVAGLNSSSSISPLGYTYQTRYGVTSDSIQKTTLPTQPQDLEANKLVGCLDLYLESGNEQLNSSLGTDIIQLQAFSDAFIGQIQNILNTGIKLDSIPTK